VSRELTEERPILDELRDLGYDVQHVQDLYLKQMRYRAAIPALVAWIPRVRDPTVKEMLVRAVTDRAARGIAGPTLIQAFETAEGSWSGLPWAIGNAIDAVADDSILEDMLRLARNPEYGRAREMIVIGLGRFRRPEVVQALIELLDDPDVSGHAVKALAKLQPPEARRALERFIEDDRGWVKQAARRAIAGIDRNRPSIG
jgi:HEAT repeat protein